MINNCPVQNINIHLIVSYLFSERTFFNSKIPDFVYNTAFLERKTNDNFNDVKYYFYVQ